MSPKKSRAHLSRQVNDPTQNLQELLRKRNKNRLDELEKSNYHESASFDVGEDDDDDSGGAGSLKAKGRARQTLISESQSRRHLKLSGTSPAATQRKSTMNVRGALLYRKNLDTLIQESGISSLPSTSPTYLTAVTPPPKYPPRLICSVCGYWGQYKCRQCAMVYCDMNCQELHQETRCERRVV